MVLYRAAADPTPIGYRMGGAETEGTKARASPLEKCNSSSKVLMVHKREGNPRATHPHHALECVWERNGSGSIQEGRV